MESTLKMIRAAGYGRVSTEEQANEGHSLDAQREYNLKYIENEKWILSGYFEDPGYSGKNLNRPDMKRLIQEINDKNIDALVVHKLDRLTRDIKDLYEMLQMFEKHNIKFVSISEKIDTDTAMGRMFVFMLGIFAQWYRENLSEEVTKGMRARAKKGIPNVFVNMFGYTRTPEGELIINEEEAKWVIWIFEQYLNGKGTPTIAKELNNMNIRRTRGGRWSQTKVMDVLENQHYVGNITWKSKKDDEKDRIIRKGTHIGIIDQETFDRVQRWIQRRRDGLRSRNSYNYAFGGVLRCGKCGGRYKGKYSVSGGTITYNYVCSNKERYHTCDQSSISETKLVKMLFKSLDMVNHNLFWKDDAKESINSEEDQIRRAIKASEERRERWQMAYGDGFMPYQDFSKRMKDEMQRVVELEEKLSGLPGAVVSTLDPAEVISIMQDIQENWWYMERSTQKQLIQELFQDISILKEGKEWGIKGIAFA
ncbi:recombinase family protein [Paenibacillus peoriae]|uniref:recombinase family protein n=1 Tax=Paenibacillus peoriae TaxID=59893 RepID=UPI0032AF8687